MNKNYLFALLVIILIVVGGIFLLSRDGTEQETKITEEAGEVTSGQLLPPHEGGSTTTDDMIVILEPALEEGDADVEAEVHDLPETEGGDTAPKEEMSINTDTVIYTDSGFSPKTITIEQGVEVTFKNESNKSMWVASSRHPTHNDYPQEADTDCLGSSFDTCKKVAPGLSWSFTFDHIGEWRYHDHISPSRTGTIIVE